MTQLPRFIRYPSQCYSRARVSAGPTAHGGSGAAGGDQGDVRGGGQSRHSSLLLEVQQLGRGRRHPREPVDRGQDPQHGSLDPGPRLGLWQPTVLGPQRARHSTGALRLQRRP